MGRWPLLYRKKAVDGGGGNSYWVGKKQCQPSLPVKVIQKNLQM